MAESSNYTNMIKMSHEPLPHAASTAPRETLAEIQSGSHHVEWEVLHHASINAYMMQYALRIALRRPKIGSIKRLFLYLQTVGG